MVSDFLQCCIGHKPRVTTDSPNCGTAVASIQGGMHTLAEVHVWHALLYGKSSSKCFGSSTLNSCSSVSEIILFYTCRGGEPLHL